MNTKTKNGKGDEDDRDVNYEEGQAYSFDDVPLYSRVYYMGRLGWVTKKGEDVNDRADGRHIEIQYKNRFAGRKTSNVHEKLVNKFLRKQEKLWVDFEHRFTEYA